MKLKLMLNYCRIKRSKKIIIRKFNEQGTEKDKTVILHTVGARFDEIFFRFFSSNFKKFRKKLKKNS